MYKVRTEQSQDFEYTYTYLKEDDKPEIKIGNYEGKIINELQDKLHRRNLQISDLKRQVTCPLSWTTISDLFFNSNEVEAIDWESCGQVGSDEFKKVVASAVDEWCSMYPEIGNSIDQEKLVEDYIRRV